MRNPHTLFNFLKVLSLFAVVSCTHNYKVPDVSLRDRYIVENKIDLRTELRLTKELREAKWEKHSMGDTFRIPLGDQLAKNSVELASTLFSRVITTNEGEPIATAGTDAVLTPRVVLVERTLGATAFGESVLSVVLKWKLEDLSGNVVWIDSIEGEGRARSGNIFTHKANAEKQIQLLLEDLFRKSFEAIKSSPEVKQFVAKTHGVMGPNLLK